MEPNNYRNIEHMTYWYYKTTTHSTELFNQLLVDTNTNPTVHYNLTVAHTAILKKDPKQKIVQLHNSLDITVSTYVLVDPTLEALNIGKSIKHLQIAQMAMYRDYKSVDVSWVLIKHLFLTLRRS